MADPASLSPAELADLASARRILEEPGLALRLAERVGAPANALVRRLPAGAQQALAEGTQRALERALEVALRSLDVRRPGPAADRLHKAVAAASGALGGAAGLAGLLLELPISLTIMLRAVADHARAQGEDLDDVATRLECLTVFAYGPRPGEGGATGDAGYFAVRSALASAVGRASAWVAQRGVADALGEKGAPALVHLLARVAQRLGVAVTDKAAAQLVPVIGAAGGAAVNALFMSHYQDTAWAHFTVRRLERAHGPLAVRRAWDAARGASP